MLEFWNGLVKTTASVTGAILGGALALIPVGFVLLTIAVGLVVASALMTALNFPSDGGYTLLFLGMTALCGLPFGAFGVAVYEKGGLRKRMEVAISALLGKHFVKLEETEAYKRSIGIPIGNERKDGQ